MGVAPNWRQTLTLDSSKDPSKKSSFTEKRRHPTAVSRGNTQFHDRLDSSTLFTLKNDLFIRVYA